MTDAEKMEVIRTMIREELSSIKTDINDHKQYHDELEAMVEKRFNEMKDMFPDLESIKAYLEAHRLGDSYPEWAAIMNDIYII